MSTAACGPQPLLACLRPCHPAPHLTTGEPTALLPPTTMAMALPKMAWGEASQEPVLTVPTPSASAW